jgi:hypothetical protein
VEFKTPPTLLHKKKQKKKGELKACSTSFHNKKTKNERGV